jgi:LPPG:FO 2-phospho-L-lactate transferase
MKILALAGGVGGAKLVDGLSRLDQPPDLTVVTNTGDDFILFGLQICPDLDTVCYNLAELENPLTGWGRAEESWESINEISKLGGPDWFRLGNKDLAVHLERTRRLRAGESLSEITIDFCRSWGIQTAVLPMSDDPVSTIVRTNQGELQFQDYFVKLNCRPEVTGFYFKGAEDCAPAEGVIQSIKQADLVVICPSNPWVSIDPILAVPGIRQEISKKIVLAISPIIGGKTVKGPAAKMYREMGITPSAAAVAAHYGEFLTGFVMDKVDRELEQDIKSSGSNAPKIFITDTWMNNRQDRVKLAEKILNFAQQLIKEEG